MITAAQDQREFDALCDSLTNEPCPVCSEADCQCDGPHESIDSALIAATRANVSASGLTLALGRSPDVDTVVVDEPWTVESIAARRASGDALVTRGGWSVSFDTSSETGELARLSCFRWLPGMPFDSAERDVMDGQTFATSDDAECYALNAGRLQWYRAYKAQKAVR